MYVEKNEIKLLPYGMCIYPDSSAPIKVVRICVGFIVFSLSDIAELFHCLIDCHVVRQNMIVDKKLNAMASTSVWQRNHGLQTTTKRDTRVVVPEFSSSS